ncbi:MAG: hypothetical protein IKH44_13750 [Bacteroidales bacterium]|nr:hypothetical protein [Bacteroidales bacterium]MBR6931278.1 hypothetical protein [Bacteroidales bacterium]
MIKFFRQSYAIQYVVIALMAIALWIPAFVSGKATMGLNEPVTPIYNLVDRLLSFSPIAQHAFAFVLLMVETLIFNAIMVNNQIVGKVSTMGAFVFVLLMSLTRTQINLYPFILSLVFILLAISNLFEIYLMPNPELNLLKTGVFIALASMCYFPSIVLVLWVLFALPIAKKGSLRLELIPIFGFLFLYFVYFVWVFLFGDFQTLLTGYRDYFTSIKFSVRGFNYKIICLLAVLVVSTIFLLMGSGSASFEKTVAVRTKISMTVIMAAFALLLLFFGGNVLMNGLIFIVLAILISYAFSYTSNTGWVNLFLTLFLMLVFANHYYFKLL